MTTNSQVFSAALSATKRISICLAILGCFPLGVLAQADTEEEKARRVLLPFGDKPEMPGQNVTRGWAWLPITKVPYSKPDAMKHPVSDEALVIGYSGKMGARAYPINMLGGPQREIVNDDLGHGVFAVNW